MRLDAFRFRHVGPFGSDGVSVSGLAPGLNVLAEPNEQGKSSLLAALETVLFLPHTSWKGEAKRLGRDDGAPVGEVDFTHNGRQYRLSKRFVKAKHAALIDLTTGETLATKREAEERVGAILGFEAGSHGPSGLLWVRQGDSMKRAEDDGQVASRLETELSTLVGGDRARAYLERTEAELGEFRTQTGRTKTGGPIALTKEKLDAVKDQLASARAARDATRRLSEALETVRNRIDTIQSQTDIDAEDAALKNAKAALETEKLAHSQRDAHHDRVKRLELEHEGAQARLMAHLQAVTDLDHATETCACLKEERQAIAASLESTRSELALKKDRLSALESQRGALAQLEQQRALRDRLGVRNEALQAVDANLNALTDARHKRDQLMADRNVMPPVTNADVNRLGTLIRDLDRIEADLSGVAAQLILDLNPDIDATLGDAPVSNGRIQLTAADMLAIENVGTIRLDAPEGQTLRAQQDAARKTLRSEFTRLDVSDLEAAIRLQRERAALDDEITLIDKQMALIAPNGAEALQDSRHRLADEIEALTAQLDDPVDETEIANAADIEHSFATARGEMAALQVEIDRLTGERARADADLATLNRQIAAAPDTARNETREATQAALSAAAATLATQLNTARQHLSDLQARITTDPALIAARIKRLTETRENRTTLLSDLRTQAVALRAERKAVHEQRDPEADVQRLEERAVALSDELSRHQRRADALTLLRDTLQTAQSDLQDQYTEPVRRELLPLLRQVIDGADIALDENLGAQGLTRDGADDALDRLSGGTQEQIAILTRLAFARLLARGGQPCPVILDDALVYADDLRRTRMFEVLQYVTSGDNPLQLLYLSCHQRSSIELGGTVLNLGNWPED